MNPHSATLLRALATLRVSEIRFTITRHGDARHHSVPRARLDDGRMTEQPFSVLSVEDLFEAFALTPHKGAYTLRVADGQLAFEARPPRQAAKISRPAPKLMRNRRTLSRRPEKLAA